MPDDLYERDILIWAEQQSALLRRVANGERVNTVDWPHVIEEIADLGNSELNAVRSLLLQAILHLFKLAASPDDLAREHWLTEIDAFLGSAQQRFTPSMRQRLDLDAVYANARTRTLRRYRDLSLPTQCPWSLDALFEGDLDSLLTTLADSPREANPA